MHVLSLITTMTDHGDYNLSQIEELILCGHCRRTFNDSNLVPKDLACKHTFCLECITTGLGKSTSGSVRERELYCVLCWKLTELAENGPEGLETNGPKLNLVKLYMTLKNNGPTLANGNGPHIDPSTHEDDQIELCIPHSSPLRLWCTDCKKPLCIECQNVEPESHKIWTLDQMKKMASKEMAYMTHMDDNVRQLARRQRQFLILIRDACTALIREVQSSLDSDWTVEPTAEIREALAHIQIALMDAKSPKEVHELFSLALLKKQSLQTKCQELIIQCQLNDLIGHSDAVFNFESLHQAVASILSSDNEIKPIPLKQPIQDPILFLTNYCMSQLYSRMHQRSNGDSAFLSHSMQRQLVITPPEVLNDSSRPSMLTPTQSLPLSEPLDPFIDTNDSQVEYNHQVAPQPASEPFDNTSELELSRPSTPPDAYSPPEPFASPPAHHAPKPFVPLAATTAQIVQMNSMALERAEPPAPIIHPPVRPVPTRSPANVSPRYYFNIDISGVAKGRIVIETRPDVAPKMCRNFDRLTNTDRKPSYKGCAIFQCWKNESVITGDYEYNTGRGGRSIYDEHYFQPDETRLPAIRGAVGMRRQQKKHDYFGYVGSQFRIVLQDTLNFTGIFGQVVEGIDIVDLIANHGDATGKPVKPITITKCGKLT
ncbi:uncharacterized protein LOC117646150 isoform X2 [Thrips palmi]|uniref:Uncharacterized protein LOC117646150 isoform X2 n=1 Tax=Thrips palmi TaxID=161013 RepID=A0A6P8YZP4_THRPL|nr:uncharacterized protein LOC117646150 isoform X2 [Thrips palmi]